MNKQALDYHLIYHHLWWGGEVVTSLSPLVFQLQVRTRVLGSLCRKYRLPRSVRVRSPRLGIEKRPETAPPSFSNDRACKRSRITRLQLHSFQLRSASCSEWGCCCPLYPERWVNVGQFIYEKCPAVVTLSPSSLSRWTVSQRVDYLVGVESGRTNKLMIDNRWELDGNQVG